MYFSSSVFLLLSILRVATAQQNAACAQLAGYQPAVAYCASRYPAPIPTTTKTSTKTITVQATTTSIKPSTTSAPASSKPNTTLASGSSAAGNSRTRTMTAIVEQTVTNCAGFTPPACPSPTSKISFPSPAFSNPFSNSNTGGFVRPGSSSAFSYRPAFGRVNAREAEPEANPQFGGSFFGGFQAVAWANLLRSGDKAVSSACTCLRPSASRTVTVSATATITATVK